MGSEPPPALQMSLKQAIGHAVSSYINWRLSGPLSPERRSAWVDYANRRPEWLRAVSPHVRVPTKFGFDIYCDRRSGIGQTLLAEGQWEGLLSRTMLACLQPDDWALDIGANIGYDSLLMSEAVGPGGTVLAFEPEHENFALLLKNAAHARHHNIVPLTIGVSDAGGLGRISVEDAYNRGQPNMRPNPDGATRAILVARLDQLLESMELRKIALLKMDIEGYEYKALVGLGDAISRVQVLTCEINHKFLEQCGASAEAIFSYMHRRGFQSFCADSQSDDRWMPFDHRYRTTSSVATHFDVLFCRDISPPLRTLIGGPS